MQMGNGDTDRPLDAASLNEQGIVDHVPSAESSSQASDDLRFHVEMAVEWAHLGGD
jgi:hypothetical protein